MDPKWNYLAFAPFLIAVIGRNLWFGICRRVSNVHTFVCGKSDVGLVRLSLSTALVLGTPVVLLLPLQLQYKYGSTWLVAVLGYLLAMLFALTFCVPILHYSKSASIYQYIEDRFASAALRRIMSAIFILQTMLYCAIILAFSAQYAASLFPLEHWLICVILGCISIANVLVGGHSAVIDSNWTTLLLGPILGLGSVVATHIWLQFDQIFTNKTEALAVVFSPNFMVNPISRFPDPVSVLTSSFFFVLHLLSASQVIFQHYQSASTVRKARLTVSLAVVWILILFALSTAWGLIMYELRSTQCPHVWLSALEHLFGSIEVLWPKLPALPGFVLSGFVWCALCTVSTGAIAMSSTLWEDFVRSRFSNSKDKRQLLIVQTTLVLFGFLFTAISVGLLLFRPNFWEIGQKLLLLLGSLSAPMTAVFLCGVFMPCANSKGVAAGLMLGLSVNIALGLLYENAHYSLAHKPFVFNSPDLLHVPNCDQMTVNNESLTIPSLPQIYGNRTTTTTVTEESIQMDLFLNETLELIEASHEAWTDSESDSGWKSDVFKISLLLHPAIGFVVTVLSILLVSLSTGSQDVYSLDWNLVFFTCNDCVERVRFKRSNGYFRRSRQPFVASESFRYAHQGPLPDTSYHNPKVKYYMENETKT